MGFAKDAIQCRIGLRVSSAIRVVRQTTHLCREWTRLQIGVVEVAKTSEDLVAIIHVVIDPSIKLAGVASAV